jgi:predicted MFS family arabinose efflux permease
MVVGFYRPYRYGRGICYTSGDQVLIWPWRSRQFWLILTMYWFYVCGSWFFFSWFPTFLERGRGFEKSELTYAVAVPFLMGVIGNLAGGYLSDRLSKRYGIKIGRRVLGVGGLAISADLFVLPCLDTWWKQPAVTISHCTSLPGCC